MAPSLPCVLHVRRFLLPLLLAGGFLCRPAAAIPVLRGDLYLDGHVNVQDAIVALRMAVGLQHPTPNELLAGDVAPFPGADGRTLGDGRISVLDAVRILRYAVKLDSASAFYGGEDPTVETSGVTLRLSVYRARLALFGPTPAGEFPLSVVVTGAERLAAAGVTLTLIGESGAPSLTVTRVEAGRLLPAGSGLLFTPPLSTEGRLRVRGAVFAPDGMSVTGTGELLRFILKADGPVPPAAAWEVTLTDADAATDDAHSPPVADARSLLSDPGGAP